MTYLPFARKWRPQDFDQVVGQKHITAILKNAISLNRVHHAYLFAGPRGIGKTSTARILSKALNCEKGLSPTPCNKCVSCHQISNSSSMDVIEIDGASNRGIDEIRNLRESVKFAPTRGRYKIYIIDEVHMLTPEAFNALLKTLEEPPAHVKFIFATTEPYKLPPTILSRCQRFDFRRIPIKVIIAKLTEIAGQEKINVEEGVFLYIARAADGSMRDAESMLDQLSNFSQGAVRLEDVIKSLGVIEQETLFHCADLIINRDTKAALSLIDRILDSGKDAKQFLSDLLGHFRNIMVAKVGILSEELIGLPEDSIERISVQAQSFSRGDIFYIINVLSNSLRMIKQLLPERIVLELCMIKLTSRDSIASIEEILSSLPEITRPFQHQPYRSVKPTKATANPQSISEPEPGKIEKSRSTSPPQNSRRAAPYNASPSVDLVRVKNAWPILVKAMAVKKMSISSYLAEGEPESTRGNTIIVAFSKEFNFHREVLEERPNKESIEAALSQIMDVPVKIEFITVEKEASGSGVGGGQGQKEKESKEPIVETTLNMFGGKVIRNQENV